MLDLSYDHDGDNAGRLRALPEGVGRLAYLPRPALRVLNLHGNEELTALPEGLCSLMGLEELYLMECNLRALPEGVGGLTGLKALILSYNHELTALPEGLCSLMGLEELHLGFCGLTTLPEGIGALTRLRTLGVRYNTGLTALPAGLGWLRNLEYLLLGGCPFLAALEDLRQREGLPALLAHLAAQGEPAAGGAR